MKRVLAAAGACSILLSAPACRSAGTLAPQAVAAPITISIVGTNDLHGGVLPRDGRGGLALFGGYVRNLRAARAADGGAVVLVDAGDMFQGTLESNMGEGAVVVSAYNALGYAAAAIGNHEFDYGPVGEAATPRSPADDPRGALKARASEARFPILSANLLDASTGRPVNWPNVKPSAIVDAAGVKVGIIGVATAETLTTTIASNVRGLAVAPLAPAITAEASKLRAAGAGVIVVAAHAGGSCATFDDPADLSSCDRDDEIMEVARALPAGLVDVIVAGHTHQRMAHDVAGIAVIESLSSWRAFGRVDLHVDRTTGRVGGRRIFPPHEIRQEPEYAEAPVAPSADIEAVLAPAVERAKALKEEPVGVTLDTPIRRTPSEESALGNLLTDLMLAAVPGSDVAMSNSGGIRADLPAGPLTYGSVFEAFPFDNRFVEITLTGAQLKQVFATNFAQDGVSIPVSGVFVSGRCEAGAMQITLVRPSGAPIRDDERLDVVTNDFIAYGGDRIFQPIGEVQSVDVPGLAIMRDAMVAELRKRDGHLNEAQLIDPNRPRIEYPGPRPIICR